MPVTAELYLRAYELAHFLVSNKNLARQGVRAASKQLIPVTRRQLSREYYHLRRERPLILDVDELVDPIALARDLVNAKDGILGRIRSSCAGDLSSLRQELMNAESPLATENLKRRLIRILQVAFTDITGRATGDRESLLSLERSVEGYFRSRRFRNSTALTEEQTFQLLVLMACRAINRDLPRGPDYSHLVRSFFAALAEMSLSSNSFRTAVCYGLVAYDLGRSATQRIYNFLIQDIRREKAGTHYPAAKAAVLKRLQAEDFGSGKGLVFHRSNQSLNVLSETPTPDERELLVDWLSKLRLWRPCIESTEIGQFRFDGRNPDNESLTEHRRIHALMCPRCLEKLTSALGVTAPRDAIRKPIFTTNDEMKWNLIEAATPDPLAPEELAEDLREIKVTSSLDYAVDIGSLFVVVGERRYALSEARGKLDLPEFGPLPSLLELRSCSDGTEHCIAAAIVTDIDTDLSLAASQVIFDFSLLDGSYEIFASDCLGDAELELLARECLPLDRSRMAHLNDCAHCSTNLRDRLETFHPSIEALRFYRSEQVPGSLEWGIGRHIAGCKKCSLLSNSRLVKNTRALVSAAAANVDRLMRSATQTMVFSWVSNAALAASEAPGLTYVQLRSSEILVSLEQLDRETFLVAAYGLDQRDLGCVCMVEIIGDADSLCIALHLSLTHGRVLGSRKVMRSDLEACGSASLILAYLSPEGA